MAREWSDQEAPMTALTPALTASLAACMDWMGVEWVVELDELNLLAQQAALGVDLVHGEAHGLEVVHVRGRRHAGLGEHCAYPDGVLCGPSWPDCQCCQQDEQERPQSVSQHDSP